MSFQVYLQSFRDGAPAGIPRDAVRTAFGRFIHETEPSFWTARYDAENSCEIAVTMLKGDQQLVHQLCVERPCGDERLWDALAAILKLGTVVLYCPGDAPPLVAAQSVVGHLPQDMVEALGLPVCVQNGKEIARHIEAT
jgi:hypothetical protein